ncbi:MAG TPA: hypothetical protein VJ650_05020 [Gemmatimonadaceae bacterium]|nr:hypothetical protein [Gemmatimonadaceae bacterium]
MSAHHDGHALTRDEILRATDRPIGRGVKLVSAIFAVIGAIVFLFGAVQGENRAWQALHVNWLFFVSISQAAVVFVAVQRITTARWSRPVVRFLEGYVAFLPVAFLLLVVIFLGRQHIFPWTHEAPPVHEKAVWFDPTFLITRDLVVFGILVLLSVWYVYTSVRLDVGRTEESGARWARGLRARMRRGFAEERREIHTTHSLQGRLAVFLCLAFGFFMSLLSWDLSMTLDMHFQSTLYSWWFFMGGWLGALTSWSLLTMWWRRHLNAYDLVTEHHFHDLGKLCFAFTAFWGYLTFGQYLVIWYGNMGEETHWARLRLIDPWLKFTLPVVFLMFVLPFFGLLSRAAKVYLPTLAFFAISSLVGLWLLRYVEVYPSLHYESAHAPFGLYEIGVALGYLGLWGLCYAAFMDAFPRMRVTLLTSPYRDQVQVPYDPETMETMPAHE